MKKTGIEDIKENEVGHASNDISAPAHFTEPEILYKQLMDTIRNYHPSADFSQIERAYTVARDAHQDQRRKSGEPYIIHPLNVAIILAELELDMETIMDIVGHEDIDMTRHYLHVQKSIRENAAERLSTRFRDAVSKTV